MMIQRQLLRLAFVGLSASVLSPFSIWAQAYPNKPVKVIVTFPPGGTPDIYGRILSQELSNLWKQSVLVDRKSVV